MLLARLGVAPSWGQPPETSTMTLLILGLLVFLGVHSVSIVAPAWRDTMHARLGEGPWKGPTALRHVALLLMLPVFPLLLSVYLPGRIKRTARHPMLLATKLWALAHLLANGNMGDVLLFGGFLAWAVADRISLKHRPQRALPGAKAGPANDAIAVAGGLALYAIFLFWAHVWLIGVSPLG